MRWLTGLFYPDRATGPGLDPRAEAQRFYRLFYGVDLDGLALDRLLGEEPLP